MRDILELLPASRTQVYDVRKIDARDRRRATASSSSSRASARSAVTGLARLDGRTVGIIANNPLVKGGALDTDACEKITSFLVLCDSFNIPIVMFVDTPGFVIGTEAERRRAPGKIMNFMNALALTTMPKLSVILRKSYGQAYLNMGGGQNSDEVAAWPTAEVSFMDPQLRREDRARPDARRARATEEALEKMDHDNEVWDIASIYAVQSVIRPARDARLPDPHARRAPAAAHTKRRGPAPDARLADELLTWRCSTRSSSPTAERSRRACCARSTTLGMPSVALYSDADRDAPYLALASETVHIGAAPARESYLDQDRVLQAAAQVRADALHPGYGFLSENAAFALKRAREAASRFIGPSPRWIDAMGHKTRARELAAQQGWPIGRGSGVLTASARRCSRLRARSVIRCS